MTTKQKPRTPYWTKVIEQAKTRLRTQEEPFTDLQMQRATSWVTCACGKQDKFIPRNSGGAPMDTELDLLGLDFYTDVKCGDPYHAEVTLEKIERRAAEILFGDDLEVGI